MKSSFLFLHCTPSYSPWWLPYGEKHDSLLVLLSYDGYVVVLSCTPLFSLCRDLLLSQVVLEQWGLPWSGQNEARFPDVGFPRVGRTIASERPVSPSFHLFCLLPPFFLPLTWPVSIKGLKWDISCIPLWYTKFYSQFCKGQTMKSPEEKDVKMVVKTLVT